jgi:hypothetical protein
MSGRIDFGGIERKLEEISRKLDNPFQNIHERQRHEENIKKQNELIKATIGLVIATICLVIVSLYVAIIQTPMPNLKLNVWEIPPAACVNNISFPYGPDVEIANVGTRTSFNTQLLITYKEPNSFYDAYFFKSNRSVNRTNPIITNAGTLYLPDVTIIGYPYWIVNNQTTTIFLNQIEPGETLDMAIRFNGTCGGTKDVKFIVTEEGYGKSSGFKTSKITWVNITLPPAGK